MKFSVGLAKDDAEKRLACRGVNRRDFMKFCAAVAAAMGMEASFAKQVAAALTDPRRPSVVYFHFAECTGCSMAVVRTVNPYIDELILDTISLDYHETLMAAAGDSAEAALEQAITSPHGFIAVVEGAIPTKDNGVYGMVGGHTMLDMAKKYLPKAQAVIAIGACATFGGVQAADPNPTQAMGVNELMEHLGLPTRAINIAGCPPSPYNFVGTVVHLLTKGMPELDRLNRPKMFYGESVHELCERLDHFFNYEFAPSFDSEEARKGWCLYEVGCKGPDTYNNCPKVKFNETNWPVQAGHPCIGCSEPKFWDQLSPFYKPV
ncbi:hydrogenase small subunit [Desulfonatronum lacustre]|uniref:hydrogenase small subunit n=1 Tax=Desulfonatronum lacustre TaxID=66849 RepID=UPI00048AE907|nr:hydrogenase small subunit [Desulfonatronum lacustre]SMP74136.1 [NiFe] hydrogenase small subunit [Desulfonatronum zhilinae]